MAAQVGCFRPAGNPATGDLRAVLAVFRFRVIPALLLDITLIRAVLDELEAARCSRFSVA